MHDQADELRHLVRLGAMHAPPQGPPPRWILVAGGKPNVGATTLAVNLSVALCGQGQQIVLVDADLDRSGVASLCEVAERSSIVDVLAGERTIHEILQRGPGGVQIVPGSWAPAVAAGTSTAAQTRLVSELNQLGPYADALVIDVGSSRSELARRLWTSADLVATWQPDTLWLSTCMDASRKQLSDFWECTWAPPDICLAIR
jgi:flagellar biosynthesis protein FlhG